MADKKLSNVRINKVYTKNGDMGETQLIGGEKRWKDDCRVEAYGEIDELNSQVGLCRELVKEIKNPQLNPIYLKLRSIQNDLFDLGTELATPEKVNNKNSPHLSKFSISKIEAEIDSVNKHLEELNSFVLPGGSVLNAQFHVARTICRRSERRLITLSKKEKVKADSIAYLNRLSDLLFVWSRWCSILLKNKETLWEPNC